MALDSRQSLILKLASDDGSLLSLINFVINYTAVDPVVRDLPDGRVLFTGGEIDEDDPSQEHKRPDSLAYEALPEGFIQETDKLSKYGRVLVPLNDPFLEALEASCAAKVLTFDREDPGANFYAQNIKKGPLGINFKLVYRPSADRGTRLVNRFITGYDKNLFVGVTIESIDMRDVRNSVIAFACASMMGIEPQHVRTALMRYEFPAKPEEVQEEVTELDILGMREFEED